MGLLNRKSLVLAAALLLAVGSSARPAFAQDLDEAIDAELDEVSAGDTPSAATAATPSAPATTNTAPVDVQLDEGDETPAANQVESQPAAPSETPAPAIVDDELKLDGEDTSSQVAAPQATPAPETPAPSEAQAPQAPVVEERTSEPAAPVAEQRPSSGGGGLMDAPNDAYEKRLGGLTRGFKQIPDVNWDEIVGERRQETYSLQTGDTLWDISSTFFGDGFFWAKLWSQNGVIDNPHQILRGKAIRFVAGTEGDAPAIGVMDVRVASNSEVVSLNPWSSGDPQPPPPLYREQVQTEVSPEELESGVVLETDELIPAPELPAANKRTPVLKELPKSFVESKVSLKAEYDSSGFIAAPPRAADKPASVFLNSFILDGAPDSLGRIEEIEASDRVASTGQSVFIKLNRDVEQGSRVTFVRQRARPKGVSGPVLDVLGIGIVDGIVKDGSNTFRATVTTSLAPVEKGAMVLAEAPPRVTVDTSGRRSEAHLKIVGGEFDDERNILGAPAVVYLSGGANAGLQKNDILGVAARRGSRRETRYPGYSHSIAILKIADVRQNVATALVVSSTEPINLGDVTTGALPDSKGTLNLETADEAATAFGQRKAIDIHSSTIRIGD